MRTNWTSSYNPYLHAIEQANTLLSSTLDESVFKPVVHYLWLNPLPENKTSQQFFDVYFPQAVISIAQKQKLRMQERALRGLGDIDPGTTKLILNPTELGHASQAFAHLISGGEDGVNEYTRINFIDEWIRQLYPSLRYLSEGNIAPNVRNPVAMSEVMLEQTESMIEKELGTIQSQIDYAQTSFAKKLSLMEDLERTEKLKDAVQSLETTLEPLCNALHPKGAERGNHDNH